ncbi:hypothetical protein [Virgibacillus necropolis]|uniref:Uncharacterized protein n=1 Tax=Virgibacillus necropolis TaxID=163877 RepID=A0A221MFJ7_9BACI|nr:hypothetical protein [Virgibacillus necropolis]ASN06448.1 hypothetical protein CFK40_16200 [Virgibacillus necropolis]
MQLYATFDHNIYFEMAISTLEKKGIKKENIYAVPLDNRTKERKLFDSIHRSDGTSLIDIGMALATAFSVIGISIGFELAWGPIYWGLISAFIGFVLGVAIRLFTELVIKKRKRVLKGKHMEVILIVDCEEGQAEIVENILWEHFAAGVAKIKKS